MRISDEGTRQLLLFGAVSLSAVAVGAAVCGAAGVPAGLWGRNLVAWLVGAAAAVAISRWAGPTLLAAALVLAPLGLAATFLSPAMQGVHRWIDLGGLHVNAALLLLPMAVVGLSELGAGRRWPWIAALSALTLIAFQPDRSQAAPLAVVIIGLAFRHLRRLPARLAVSIVAVASVGVAWLQPDPLQPVPEVEGVLGLAQMISPALAAVAFVLMIGAALIPAAVARRTAGFALSALLVGWALAPEVGAYPAPWVGIGLSPIIGAWLGVGLASSRRRAA